MPSTSLKKLYVAKCLKDLEADTKVQINVKGRATNSLVISAQKVFHAAEMASLDKDEEKAYVQYMRFLELVLALKKRPDFQTVPDNKKLSLNANHAIGKAEKLKASLSKRYSILEEANCLVENEKNDRLSSLQNSNSEVILENNMEVLNAEPSKPEVAEIVEESISSSKLLSLMNADNSFVIIMDTRHSRDFEKSHIKHVNCINIPEEHLSPGTTAARLESLLPRVSLGDWYKRGKADHIIILDFDSKDEKHQSTHIDVLKQAMSKWDQNCSLKKPPMVLKGGYRDWMLKYPMYTTQALNFDSLIDSRPPTVLADVSILEYPDLDEPEKSLPQNKENFAEPGVFFKKSNVPVHTIDKPSVTNSNNSRGTKSAPTVDRKSKPTIDRSSKSSLGNRKNLNNAVSSNHTLKEDRSLPIIQNFLPTNGRVATSASSPTLLNAKPHPDGSQLVTSLNEESSLANESLELTKQQLAKEQEFEKLRLKRELEAEESIRIEIQKREEQLLDSLRKLELESKEKELVFQKLKDDNVILKKQLEEKASKEFQKQKEKEILEMERKKKEVQESVARLREQRKQQELAQKRKELSKPNGIPREAVSANTALKRNMSQDQNNTKPSEYTIPLSRQSSTDSSSRGLVRSHSSPNIAQMVNEEESPQRKIPAVDRSLKPKATTPSYQLNEINRARLRNLNPVYGNCPVRPATGLRNLGNTCFMNSVIQCLSNTIPLAEYFTSGQYMEDINRENKYGTGGEVAEEFAVVIRALWMGQYKSFSPKDFKNTVSKCLAVCIGNEQQDSHEFLVVLMEKLHADLNKSFFKVNNCPTGGSVSKALAFKKRDTYLNPNKDTLQQLLKKLREMAAVITNSLASIFILPDKSLRPIPKLESCDENKFWLHHKNYNSSKMSDMFEGLLKSTLTCMSCRTTSDSFEVFSCLSLPIMTSKCSLEECFRHFLKSEKISGEAAWDCPKCKQKKEAEKRLRICHVPEILVIQLKRFSYEGLWRRKLQTTVSFDFLLDVPYEKNFDVYHRKYNLYGIVNHFGTLEGGHYTAYCNTSNRKWFKYDDHEVSEISASDIRTSAAYLLFYRATDIYSSL